jgi:hypothetical protein
VQGSVGGKQVLNQLAMAHPNVSVAWVDGGYNSAVVNHGGCWY